MKIKILLIALTSILSMSSLLAQDKLYKKNGDMMDVKVTEVSSRLISYQKSGNTDGPTYKIEKGDVAKIVYANGTEDNFAPMRNENGRKKETKYGNNIISVMPMQITSDVGVGLAYERVIDKDGILSFYLPVTIAFANNNTVDPITGVPTNTPTGSAPTYFIMPGLKFYPTGGKGVVRYAVGPNLAYITGERFANSEFVYDNNGNITGQIPAGWKSRTALGIMVTNSLNINPTAHLHLGLELGLGFTYFNKVDNWGISLFLC